ncbi:2-polyprenyl-3-methyl-5-hydroxy-6-metoxy-1,4-benzoquinol methylase [Isoptericola jiangsuensis]|uniref:2-polyprenyl-3-methyl-5-hydroxy-6-metoxy-1, 4-benzoquinol methylase n=1 Tax=Isoptericola jiangsuensis TaxID=548579 RepID=A0A2A9F1A5_9MICO|nr:methyltransferase domain-containing protein [Isoptericola jiangsuensis]PFG44322.1 2-polyprenyl-3-methyl-5-hydroxy-6-metoxy-1,4-benzoquinol methylase [Isoptericola jiangsuensis]
MTARLLALLRSPLVRWAFLLLAVGLAAYAVWAVRDDLADAVAALPVPRLAAALALSLLFVGSTLLSWRAVLADLGSPVGGRAAVSIFGISQLGKFVPGGVWNVVAAAEVGADHGVPRARTMTATAVATGIGVVSGAVTGVLALPFLAADALGSWAWALWLLPCVAVLLLPPVLNRLLALAFRLARRSPLTPLSWRGLAAAAGWAVAGWVCAGAQVWLLATGLGMPADAANLALTVGGYALAWTVGFLVVVVPAGAGAREIVLLAVLAGLLPDAEVLLVVLVSRVLVTLADLLYAGVGAAFRHRARGFAPLAPHAWLRWDVVRRALPRRPSTVLEIGSGQGAVGMRIAARHDYTAVETDETSWRVATGRITGVAPDARVLHGDESVLDAAERFDVVCAFEVIEHVDDDAAALAAWAGRLRPGGMLLLSTPAWPDRFGPWDVLAGHYRRYDPADLAARLRAAGLVDVDVRCYDAPLGYLLEAVRNPLARRRERAATAHRPGPSADGAELARQTAGSGRRLQPSSRTVGTLIAVGVAPFRLWQRALPRHGTGLVAVAHAPTDRSTVRTTDPVGGSRWRRSHP